MCNVRNVDFEAEELESLQQENKEKIEKLNQ